jgi:hypothetical protein
MFVLGRDQNVLFAVEGLTHTGRYRLAVDADG